MKTIIWKELRENARWAGLAFFVLLLAEMFTLTTGGESITNWAEGITLASNTFLLVSVFGCSAVGAALGALQILPELSRDRWAGLLHRPVPRHVIFLGKVAAGLILYALATGLPLLCSVIYVATPGHIPAPFVPGLAQPAISDLLLGVVFYLAAVLLSLHSGRWWGSRAAIILGAIAVLILHLAGGWPFTLPLLAAGTLLLAAWGAMLGSPSAQPWFTRLAIGLVILVGVEAGLVLAGAAVGATGSPPYLDYMYSNFFIAQDGTVLISKSDGKGSSIVTDPDGKVVTDERYVSDRNGLYPYPLADRKHIRSQPLWARARSSDSWVSIANPNYDTTEIWYRMVGPHSYFVGYDKLSSRCIGIFDADGFKNATATPRPFAQEPHGEAFQSPPYVYSVGPQLLTFDFTERQMSAPVNVGDETIYGAVKYPYIGEHYHIAVALESEIRVFAAEGTPVFKIPYAYDAHRWPNVGIAATEDSARTFVEYMFSYYSPQPDTASPVHLDVFDKQGQRIATYAMAVSQAVPKDWRAYFVEMLTPPVPSFLYSMRSHARTLAGEFVNPGVLAPLAGLDMKPAELSALFGFALLLAALAFVWARRINLSVWPTVIWIVATLVFGLGGFFAYRLATEWPALVRCPSCGRKRAAGATECLHCHKPWEPLPANGSEIFEPA